MSPRKIGMLAVTLVAVVALAGCGSASKLKAADIEGDWVLESFGGVSALTPVDPTVTTTLTLKSGEASGNGGVNSFSGTYKAKNGGSLTFGDIAATEMAGPQAAMDQESRFFEALKNTRHFDMNEGKLILSGLDNDTLAVLVAK